MKVMINKAIYDANEESIIIKFSKSDIQNIKNMRGLIYAAFPDHFSKKEIDKIELEMDAFKKI